MPEFTIPSLFYAKCKYGGFVIYLISNIIVNNFVNVCLISIKTHFFVLNIKIFLTFTAVNKFSVCLFI
jgi:hypothetical protein